MCPVGREVVRFGFWIPSHAAGICLVLVEMMWDGTEIVEELAQQIPAAALAHHIGAEEFVAQGFDSLLQKDTPPAEIDVA